MAEQTPQPAGFPNCPTCPLRKTGSAAVCGPCARRTLPPLDGRRCPICSQATEFGVCANRLCLDPARAVARIDAIASYSGALRATILRYKEENNWGWASIFGRVLVGHLDEYYSPATTDLIVANPTAPQRIPRHTELVIESAANEDILRRWRFDTEAITKPAATRRSKSGVWVEKSRAADEYATALVVDRDRIAGQRIVIYDDICTTGLQLNAVARRLLDDGAQSVEAIVLARAPWK